MIKAPLKLKLQNSFKGIFHVLKKPHYMILIIVGAFLANGLVLWALNLDLVRYILFEAPISILDKLTFFWDVQISIYSSYSSPQATGIILFGLLFGINAALITYVVRHISIKNIPKKSGGGGLAVAIISGGCIACGTSVFAPLLASLGATSTAFTADLSNYLNWISILLISYSIYKLGSIINNNAGRKNT